ncbi:MAG: alpha/beta hydrolase [Magnetovibrio sp.]|nr:alpha/beta hydrolase [Magnetovibrio sp.]|tara:strand:- start:654 stop:1556 length:903 start_codon:yes stop_codon:yes gene_type:complete
MYQGGGPNFFWLFLVFLVVVPSSRAEEVKTHYSGLTLNAQLQLSEGKSLRDGIVILVHGTLTHNGMETINNLAEVINERGLNTLAINLSLGINDRHGMYESSFTSRHKHDDALEEIAVWIEWLKSKNVGEIILLGHSRGGTQVARYVTLKRDSRVSKAVLLAPTMGLNRERFRQTHGTPLGEVLTKAETLVKGGNGDQILKGAGILYCKNADVAASSFVSYYRSDNRLNTSSILGASKVPVLVIGGGNDAIALGLAEAVKPIADGKHISFKVIDDADHFFLDLFAEDVVDFIDQFVAGRT